MELKQLFLEANKGTGGIVAATPSTPSSFPMNSKDYKGDLCPACGSPHLTGEGFCPIDMDKAHRKVCCEDCCASWTEILALTGYGNLNIR